MQGRIWHAGPLLEAVQKAALFKDSKAFVYALNSTASPQLPLHPA